MSHTVTVTHGDTAESLRDTQRHTPLRAPLLAAHPETWARPGRRHGVPRKHARPPRPSPPRAAHRSRRATHSHADSHRHTPHSQPLSKPVSQGPTEPHTANARFSAHSYMNTQPPRRPHAAPHHTAPTWGPGPHPSHTQESQAHNLSYPLVTCWLSQRQHAHTTACRHRDPVCPPSLWGQDLLGADLWLRWTGGGGIWFSRLCRVPRPPAPEKRGRQPWS